MIFHIITLINMPAGSAEKFLTPVYAIQKRQRKMHRLHRLMGQVVGVKAKGYGE